MVYLSCRFQLIKISMLKVNHCWFYTPLVYDSHLFWGISFIFPELWLVFFLPSGHSLRAETLTERNSYVSGSPLDEYFLNWIGIAIARWRRTLLMHYGMRDDGVETFSIFLFVLECYSESEQEDPEIAVQTPSLHHSAESLSSSVGTKLACCSSIKWHHVDVVPFNWVEATLTDTFLEQAK